MLPVGMLLGLFHRLIGCAGPIGFTVDQDVMDRHRERWGDSGNGNLAWFPPRDAFRSAEDAERAPACRCSRLPVRGLPEQHPREILSHARGCGPRGPARAAAAHPRMTPEQVAPRMLRPTARPG
jgi:hypothetical protein